MPQVRPALLAAQSVVSTQVLQPEVAFMVQVRTVSPEQLVAPMVAQPVPTVVPTAGHWQAAVLPVATQSWPFMQVVSLPLLKKQPSASLEQVPTVPAVGQKVPSAVQPRAPLPQVQS